MKRFYKILFVALFVVLTLAGCKSAKKNTQEVVAPVVPSASFSVEGAGMVTVFSLISDNNVRVKLPEGVGLKDFEVFMRVASKRYPGFEDIELSGNDDTVLLTFKYIVLNENFYAFRDSINTDLKDTMISIFVASKAGIDFEKNYTVVLDFGSFLMIISRVSGNEVAITYPESLYSTAEIRKMATFMTESDPVLFENSDIVVLENGKAFLGFRSSVSDINIDQVAYLIKEYFVNK